jgi:hypothetical protein
MKGMARGGHPTAPSSGTLTVKCRAGGNTIGFGLTWRNRLGRGWGGTSTAASTRVLAQESGSGPQHLHHACDKVHTWQEA